MSLNLFYYLKVFFSKQEVDIIVLDENYSTLLQAKLRRNQPPIINNPFVYINIIYVINKLKCFFVTNFIIVYVKFRFSFCKFDFKV